MKEFYKKIISDDEWLIEEEDFRRDLQGMRETLFTLGNGYLGSRGVLEELPYDSHPGTFIAGVYDNTGAIVTELVNTPNPIFFRINCGGEKLDPIAMDVLEHRRALDMRKAMIFRKTVYSNHKKERFNYQSARFFSAHDKHVGVMQVCFTPLDAATDITVHTMIDTSVTNAGMLTEGRKKHFQTVELSRLKGYRCVQTFEKGILLGYSERMTIERGKKKRTAQSNILKLRVRKGESVCFTKFF
jgi:trehalose/maltose hydrolase-like predicted phosphorylase